MLTAKAQHASPRPLHQRATNQSPLCINCPAALTRVGAAKLVATALPRARARPGVDVGEKVVVHAWGEAAADTNGKEAGWCKCDLGALFMGGHLHLQRLHARCDLAPHTRSWLAGPPTCFVVVNVDVHTSDIVVDRQVQQCIHRQVVVIAHANIQLCLKVVCKAEGRTWERAGWVRRPQ